MVRTTVAPFNRGAEEKDQKILARAGTISGQARATDNAKFPPALRMAITEEGCARSEATYSRPVEVVYSGEIWGRGGLKRGEVQISAGDRPAGGISSNSQESGKFSLIFYQVSTRLVFQASLAIVSTSIGQPERWLSGR